MSLITKTSLKAILLYVDSKKDADRIIETYCEIAPNNYDEKLKSLIEILEFSFLIPKYKTTKENYYELLKIYDIY